MAIIINLRGANGSGKSTVVREIMGETREVTLHSYEYTTALGLSSQKQVVGNVDGHWWCSVGPYRTDCGGCDGIRTQDLICEAVRSAARKYRVVFFEGVIVSTIFKRYLDLDRELSGQGHRFIWAYLDTPLDVCLERIQLRNKGKAINEKLVADKIKSITRTKIKARYDFQRKVIVLPYSTAGLTLKIAVNEELCNV